MTRGRIDVHSHLLPGVDDGCETVEQSIECARMLVAAGYTHALCTPHVWPSNPHVTTTNIPAWVASLQKGYDDAGVPLRLIPGGEMNLHADLTQTPPEQVVTIGLGGKYVLIDLWANELPENFASSIRWLKQRGLTVILAHPERMRAVQDDPTLADLFEKMGILLQGNLQCLSDRATAPTRRVAEQYLREGRYFLLGSDTHRPDGVSQRITGLQMAIELAGAAAVDRLTIDNPHRILTESGISL